MRLTFKLIGLPNLCSSLINLSSIHFVATSYPGNIERIQTIEHFQVELLYFGTMTALTIVISVAGIMTYSDKQHALRK